MPHFVDVVAAAQSLRECPLDGSSSRQETVDLSKKFGKIAEEWLTVINDSGGTFFQTDSLGLEDILVHKVTLHSCPSVILGILTTSGVVHDSFQVAFQLSVDICFLFHQWQGQDDQEFGLFLATIVKDCMQWINSVSLTSVIDLKIVESLVIFISSIYETYFGDIRLSISLPPPDDCLDCLLTLLQRMKQQMTIMKTTPVKPSDNPCDDLEVQSVKVEKEIRACFSDIRASCIVTVSSIILACPGWVVADTDRYWSMCTSSLSTPLLFSAGYRASKTQTTTSSSDKLEIQHKLSSRIITHLQSALQNISRFTRSAADDIITTIKELTDQNCLELLPCIITASDQCGERLPSVGLLPALLLSYRSHPKFKSTTLRTNEKATWKVAVISVIEDIFHLAKLTISSKQIIKTCDFDAYIGSAHTFTESFVQCAVSDVLVLYRVMDIKLDSTNSEFSRKESRSLALEHFGTSDGEVLASLLSSLTACLVAFLECDARVCSLMGRPVYGVTQTDTEGVGDGEGDRTASLTLSKLAKSLDFIKDRKVVFEDDQSQLIGEADLLNKILKIK